MQPDLSIRTYTISQAVITKGKGGFLSTVSGLELGENRSYCCVEGTGAQCVLPAGLRISLLLCLLIDF